MQNILIDELTAELIHIDLGAVAVVVLFLFMCCCCCCCLGVAFEQGRTLPTPETVPFRLTRDVVDGMGIAGVEGVFRRCCEEVMKVMRASHEELRTIVEVRERECVCVIVSHSDHYSRFCSTILCTCGH